MADRVIQRNDTAARWQSVNPVLATGEIGIEIDGAKGYKIGDGKTRWNDLPYPANPTNVVQELGNNENAVPSQKLVTEKLSELGSEVINSIYNFGEHNLVRVDEFTENGYLDKNGNIQNITNWVTCPRYFVVKQNKSYHIGDKDLSIVLYDKNYNVINHLLHDTGVKTDFTIPEGSFYVRFSTYNYNLKEEGLYFSENEEGNFEEYPIAKTRDGLPFSVKSIGGLEAFNEWVKNAIENPTLNIGGYNLFNDNILTEVGYIGEDGELNSSYSDWKSSLKYLPCKPNVVYYHGKERSSVAFYDIRKKLISQVLFDSGESGEITSPNNTTYVRVSVSTYSIGKDELYFSDKPYGKFEKYPIIELDSNLPISPKSINGVKNVTDIRGNFIVNSGGYNLVRDSLFTENGYINSKGELTIVSNWISYSEYICCKSNTDYYYSSNSGFALAFYDVNKKIVQHFTINEKATGTVKSANDAYYVKISTYTWNLDGSFTVSDANENVEEYPIAKTRDGFPLSMKSIAGLRENIEEIHKTISEFSESSDVLLSLQYSDNLVIGEDITELGYINKKGELQESYGQYGWKSSKNFVICKPNTTYMVVRNNQLAVIEYDLFFNVINHYLDIDSFTTSENASYIKISAINPSSSIVYPNTLSEAPTESGKYPRLKIASKSGMPVKYYGSYVPKVATLGTSITYRGHYQKIISRLTGISFFNNGISGASMRSFAFHRVPSSNEVDRLLNASDFEGVDAIIICGYANDLWWKIGSMDSEYVTISEEAAASYSSLSEYAEEIGKNGYISSVRSVVEYITRICPSIPILLSSELPMSRGYIYGENDGVDFKKVYYGSNATCEDFSNALKEVAEYYSIPYVNMQKEGQINILNYTIYYDGNDIVHPNFKEFDEEKGAYPNSGMLRMATLMIEGIKKVLPYLT